MKNNFRKVRMDDVVEIIKKKGYYYTPADKFYDHFTGPELIVVTDDPDFVKKHPKLANMVILSVSEFEQMAEVYNNYLRNEIREIRRQKEYHNDEGYYEDCIGDTEGNSTYLKIKNMDINPVEKNVLETLTRENIENAMNRLNANQYRRVYAYYFKNMTYRQIADAEGVSDKSVRESIEGSLKKLKKFL